MSIDPQKNPQDAFKLGIKLFQNNNLDKFLKLNLAFIKFNHFEYSLKLIQYSLTNPIKAEIKSIIIKISKAIIDQNKPQYLKSIDSLIIKTTGNKAEPILSDIKSLISNTNKTDAVKNTQKNEDKKQIDIYSMSTKDSQINSTFTTTSSNDLLDETEINSFNEFYKSFITDKVKSLLVSSERGSTLGQYSVHITKEYIDFHKIEGQNHKKYIYYFESNKLTINKEPKPASLLRNFYKMMDTVSKDVKHNRANLMQESF